MNPDKGLNLVGWGFWLFVWFCMALPSLCLIATGVVLGLAWGYFK